MATKNRSMPKRVSNDRSPFRRGLAKPLRVRIETRTDRGIGNGVTSSEVSHRFERYWYLKRKGQTFPAG